MKLFSLLVTHLIKQREMIFVQHNYLSHVNIMFLFSLFIFLSIVLTNKKRENESRHKSCLKRLFKHYLCH